MKQLFLIFSIIFNLIVFSQGTSNPTFFVHADKPSSYSGSGETTASITPAANGPYWVVVSDVDDCLSDTTSFDVTFVSGTGILSLENVFNIYPNPTNDIVNIDTKRNNQYLSATVYDIFGKLLINTKNTKISLNKFEDGVYILEINTPKNTYTTRIIKH